MIVAMTTMPAPQRRYTIEEYLEFEERARDKHEYRDGEIKMMSGGTYSQSLINANLMRALGNRLAGAPCRPVDSNLRVRVGERSSYVYPDVSVICGPPVFDPNDPKQTTVLNPKAVFETLSDSTESYDRGEKFLMYRDVDSLEEYVLVSQHCPRVETFTKQPDGSWRIERAVEGLERSAPITCLGIELPLIEVYKDVTFPATGGNPPAAPS
jgi:Uma2 family endonuclease